MTIGIRTAVHSDYPAIARIQQACAEAAQWPIGDYSNYNVLIALVNDAAAGFCAWRTVAPGEHEILNLGVDPVFRKRGIASALLNALCDAAKGDIFLEVAENNPAAISLYHKNRWEQIATRPSYYEHGSTAAIVMKKRSW